MKGRLERCFPDRLPQLEALGGAIKATHPDFRYQPIAGPEETGNGGRIRWVSGRPGEAPVYPGTDFIIARDGQATRPPPAVGCESEIVTSSNSWSRWVLGAAGLRKCMQSLLE
jgi:hypothetical protein